MSIGELSLEVPTDQDDDALYDMFGGFFKQRAARGIL